MTDEDRSLASLLNSTNKTVFSTMDFSKLWKYDNYSSLIQRISYLKKTGKIIQLKKGFYQIEGRKIDELELANKLRTPSYISFETVLLREGIIFQWDNRITLAGKESISINVLNLKIIFRQLKDEILLNKNGVIKENNYYIATKERAITDTLYINPKFTFDNVRSLDFNKIKNLTKMYSKKSMLTAFEKLKNHAESY